VAKLGQRWVWLDSESMWSLSAIEQVCLVGSTLHPRTHDDRWVEVARPFPELVAARRRDVQSDDFDEGWEVLYARLVILGRERTWAAEAAGQPDPARAEGMGRLALVHLATLLDHTDAPILAPSDNGARRDLDTVRSHPAARVAALHGVEVAEPWTFLLTRDELAAVTHDGRPELRYDDSPSVWSSLAAGDDGWLLRHEVRQPTLEGWLGLRMPYDGTAGVLVRTTDRLVALHDLDHRVPCHGLLWPAHDHTTLGDEQLRTVRLAALRLYQELLALWEKRPEPDAVQAIRSYAFAYAWLARQRGELTGTARQLAKRVEVLDEDGHVWGPIELWLDTDEARRPPPPVPLGAAALVPEADPEQLPMSQGDVEQRLTAALADPTLSVYLALVPGDPLWPPGEVDDGRSNLARVVLRLNRDHVFVKAGLAAPGRAREVLLLELARLVVEWAAPRGARVDLASAHQTLVAQRFDA